MRYCTECEKQIINENNQYCTHCGALLIPKGNSKNSPKKESSQSTSSGDTDTPQTYTITYRSGRRRKTTITKTIPNSSNTSTSQKNKSRNKSSGKSRLELIGFFCCVTFLIVLFALKSQGESINTVAQLAKGQTAEEVLREGIDERKSLVTVSMNDLNAQYGGFSNSSYYIFDILTCTPEYYWLDYGSSSYTSENDESIMNLHLNYFEELDNSYTQSAIDQVTQDILNQIPSEATEWEKAKIIHDELCRRITYEGTEYSGSIYGALVDGKAVCCGYALAYEYLLNMVGIPCDTVCGYVVDDVRDNLGDINNERLQNLYETHAWNVVTFTSDDGSQNSYIVDLTWDDTDIQDSQGNEYISYSWFCLSLEEFRETGRFPYSTYDYSQWDMDSREMNYFVQMDSVVTTYDIDFIADAMNRQIEAGNNLVSVCWDDISTYMEAKQKIEDGDISKICQKLNSKTKTYSMTQDRYTTGKYCLTIYLE